MRRTRRANPAWDDGDKPEIAKIAAAYVRHYRDVRAKRASIVLPGIGTINGDEATSELLLNILGAVAQFERDIMLARQREGIAKAKAEGKYLGRQKTAQALADQVLTLARQGLSRPEIARRLTDKKKKARISERSVYRILSANKEAA